MKIFDLENLKKLPDGVTYDLTESTYRDVTGAGSFEYTVNRGEDMRMDLICKNMFKNTDYVDLICSYNRIENPLNIKQGTQLKFPASNEDAFRITPKDNQALRSLADPTKNSRKDTDRLNYNKELDNLPPTTLPTSTEQIKTNGRQIIIGANLF